MGRELLPAELIAATSRDKEVDDIVEVVLELTGEIDWSSWHWIVRFKDGGFAHISAYLDIYGWTRIWDGAKTMEEALSICPENVRKLFEDMLKNNEQVRMNNDCY